MTIVEELSVLLNSAEEAILIVGDILGYGVEVVMGSGLLQGEMYGVSSRLTIWSLDLYRYLCTGHSRILPGIFDLTAQSFLRKHHQNHAPWEGMKRTLK